MAFREAWLINNYINPLKQIAQQEQQQEQLKKALLLMMLLQE